MQQKELAKLLGISPAMVSRLAKRGMPSDDLERAQRWRKRHLEPGRIKGVRAGSINPLSQSPGKPIQTPPPYPSDPTQGANSLPPKSEACPPMILANGVRLNGGSLGEGFESARTREKIAAANLAEIEEAALRGTYLVKVDFERYLFNAGRMLRDTLTNCARRIGAEVSGLANAGECEAVIDREHRAALASFAQALRHTLKIEVENNPINKPIEGRS